MKRYLISGMMLCFAGCATIQEVSYRGGVGNEVRRNKDTDHRFSVNSGLNTKFINGVDVGTVYRNRVVDFVGSSMEHGFFVNVKIPLWKKSK